MRIRGSKPRFGSADNPENFLENNVWEFIYSFFTRRRPGSPVGARGPGVPFEGGGDVLNDSFTSSDDLNESFKTFEPPPRSARPS